MAINSFLAEGSIQLLFGEPGSFKTTLCLCCAKAVASGESVLGMKTRRRRVIYLDHENPPGVIRDRCIDLGLDLPKNPNLVLWDRRLKDLPHPEDPQLQLLVRQCAEETGHGPWMIFDSWSSMLRPGDGGESTGQIAPLFSSIRRLVDFGATVTILDHSKKYDRRILYGGLDKQAKADTIHNIQICENQIRPEIPIVTVDSHLKRFSPIGEGKFAFEVKSWQDKQGNWHISDLHAAPDPVEVAAKRSSELLTDLIRTNPEAGQEELATMASQAGLPRDQAIRALKAGILKMQWKAARGAKGRLSYQLL